MNLNISIRKDGKELAGEVISNPHDGDITSAIGRLFHAVRMTQPDEVLWDCQIDLHQTEY